MVLILWFSLNKMKWHKTAEVFLIGMSLWFYAYFNFSYLFIIVGSCLFNFLISYFINRIEKNSQKIFCSAGIGGTFRKCRKCFTLPHGVWVAAADGFFLTLPRKVIRTLVPSTYESRHQGERRARKCLRASYFAFSPPWIPLTCAVMQSKSHIHYRAYGEHQGFSF